MRALPALMLGLMASLPTTSGALACRGYQWEETIFFDEVPADTDAPAIAQVTIIGMAPSAQEHLQVGVAWLKQVIKGPIHGWTLRIVAAPTSCGGRIAVGDRGIVMGALQRDAHGAVELVARSESWGERERRKDAAKGVAP